MNYWQETINSIETQDHDFKNHQLPLARIKKVMKTDEEVRMISAEAPILFAKGCDIFITELTMRAWIHAEQNKRRTLQKSDIAAALQKSDMFDFLIDVVPREEDKRSAAAAAAASAARTQGSVSESRQGSYVQQQGTTSSSENAAAAANANANANAANAGSSVPGQVPEGQFEAAQYHYNDINYENGRY
jgi:histone H3/H4